MRLFLSIYLTSTLLGAMSVIVQASEGDMNPMGDGKFTFVIPEFFDIECENSTNVTDPVKMIVDNESDLQTAEATVTCRGETKTPTWYMGIKAQNQGKMTRRDDGSLDPILLDDGNSAEIGVLGMWFKFIDSPKSNKASIGIIEPGATNVAETLVERGIPSSDGIAIRNFSAGKINLATMHSSSATRFRAYSKTDAGDIRSAANFAFEIHAAFVSAADIGSAAGTYIEDIELELSSTF